MKTTIGQHICLEENISSINVLVDGDKEDIEQAVSKLIATAGPGGGLIVATGGGVSSDVPPEKISMMIAAVEKYGRYPLAENCYQKLENYKKNYYNDLGEKNLSYKTLTGGKGNKKEKEAFELELILRKTRTLVGRKVLLQLALKVGLSETG